MRSFLVLIMLAATWWVLSWKSKTLIVSFGVVSCVLVVWLSTRMDKVDEDAPEYRLGLRPILFLPWLLWEIVKSNLHVARVVLSPTMPIHQELVRVRVSQETDLGQVIHGNSITLTPGTTTLDIRNDEFLVHALTQQCADDVRSGAMDRKCAWLDGSPVPPAGQEGS